MINAQYTTDHVRAVWGYLETVWDDPSSEHGWYTLEKILDTHPNITPEEITAEIVRDAYKYIWDTPNWYSSVTRVYNEKTTKNS